MPKTSNRPSKSSSARPAGRKPAGKPAARPAGKSPASRTRSTHKKPQPSLWNRISAERKLDLLGVVLALVGLLTLLSLFSSNRSSVTGAWVGFLQSLAGWGMFLIPLGLIAFGLWLVFRRIEKFPAISAGRVIGSLLLYINLLAWIHLFTGGGWGKEMAGKGVAEGMRGGAFVDAGEFDGGFDGFLRVRFVQMKASEFVWRGWQARQLNRRKEPLPHPFFGGARIFLLQRVRQKDSGDVVLRPLLLMPRFELFDVRQQFRDDSLRQRHGAIFLAFAVMHGQDAGVEIEAMDAEIQAFEQA